MVRKRSRSVRAWRQEVAALEALGGRLDGMPALLDANAATRTLDMTALPGAPAGPHDPDAHRAAGAWLARLHAWPAGDDDPLPPRSALVRRADAALSRARAHLDPSRHARAAHQLAGLAELDVPGRAWCHRDFTPRNWLADPFGVVDFEHARLDVPTWDLVKLAAEVWPGRPVLRDAFLHGYGTPPDPALLEALCLLHGLATLAWGRDHHDAAFTALGEQVLDHFLPC